MFPPILSGAVAWCFLSCLPLAVLAAQPFQLKGLELGTDPVTACRGAAITQKFKDAYATLQETVPDLLDLGATECDVPISTFGGVQISEAATLLFVDNRLIFIKMSLQSVDLSDVADLLQGLREQYGKSTRTRSDPFVIDTWRQKKQRLSFERNGGDVEILLISDPEYKVFQARLTANKAKLEKALQANRSKDMR